MGTISFIRCYDLAAHTTLATMPLPTWFTNHVQIPYLDRRQPLGVKVAGEVKLQDGSPCQRFVLAHPILEILEVILVFNASPLDKLVRGGAVNVLLNRSSEHWQATQHDVSPEGSPQWICDMTYQDVTQTPPVGNAILRTGFNVVALGTTSEWQRHQSPHSASIWVPEAGLSTQMQFSISEHQVIGVADEPIQDPWRALHRLTVVAGRINRARHLEKRVLDLVDSSIDRAAGAAANSMDSTKIVAKLQEQALLFQSESSAVRFYNSEESKTIHGAIDQLIGIPSKNLERISSIVDGFSGLVQTYSALTLDRAQRRFGAFGLLFGGLSVVFAAIAIISLFETQGAVPRLAVGTAVLLIALAMWGLWVWLESGSRALAKRKTESDK